MHWGLLIDEAALATVLPDEYSHFARPIKDGLTVFLEGLPHEHQQTVMQAQAALGVKANVSERLAALAQSCPVLQKLGQILARDQRLAPQLREHLRELESLPPTVPLNEIEEILARELGPLQPRGVTLIPPAIAEASVAVVIPFRQSKQLGPSGPQDGVFKILKPGIKQRLELELELLEQVGSHLDQRCEQLQIPHLDYQESFQQVREKLSYEIRLDEEQRHLVRAKDFYANDHRVQIPTLFRDHCTENITAMQRVTGWKITDHTLACSSQKRRFANLVAEALIIQPIFADEREAMFHSDPHAGNLFLTTDQRLAILDWSLVGSLGAGERVAIVQIMLGAVTLDASRIVTVLSGLAERQSVDQQALGEVVRGWISRIRHGQFPGLAWLVGMLDDAVQLARLRVTADLMLFRKSLHTLDGVLAAVASDDYCIDDVLLREFLRHFAAEWPGRWLSSPLSRDFATRLSNMDLTQTLLSCPSALARFWTGCCFDALGAIRTNGV